METVIEITSKFIKDLDQEKESRRSSQQKLAGRNK
jgi:hypothetical protein